MSDSSKPIRDASTVLPLRNGSSGLEVFMVKRNSRMGFLGGAHVFPGGAVDEADRQSSLDALLSGFDAPGAAGLLRAGTEERARGFYVAAIRELFEEAGILLARDHDDAWTVGGDDPVSRDRFAEHRRAVTAGEHPFATVVEAEGLRLACDSLCYFAHWITPKVEVKRFDTRFFLARMPDGQDADHDRGESIEGAWLTPAEALARYARREIEMVPPTICSLDRLQLDETVDDALAAARALEVVEIRPKIAIEGENVTLLYPGDDDYETGVARTVEDPGRMLDRLVLREGIWVRP